MQFISNNWKILAGLVGSFVGGVAVGTQFPTEAAAKKKLSKEAAKLAAPATPATPAAVNK